MFYYSDYQLDQWLMDDITGGDVTSRALGLENGEGRMTFACRSQCRVSGAQAGMRMLRKLGLEARVLCDDGRDAGAGDVMLEAVGNAAALHMGWKAVQNVLEWSCGVAGYMAAMLRKGRAVNAGLHIACTRKCIPGTKPLATAAVVHGGGIIHRGGTAETVLLFANHRRFLSNPGDWTTAVKRLREAAPEKKIIVEANTMDEAKAALEAGPDIIQLDKFQPEDIRNILALSEGRCMISAAGGVTLENVDTYATTGVPLIVTSSPYYAKAADIKVSLEPSV